MCVHGSHTANTSPRLPTLARWETRTFAINRIHKTETEQEVTNCSFSFPFLSFSFTLSTLFLLILFFFFYETLEA